MEVGEQFTRDCTLMDSLVKQQPLQRTFPPAISVLPVDVKRSLDKSAAVNAAVSGCVSNSEWTRICNECQIYEKIINGNTAAVSDVRLNAFHFQTLQSDWLSMACLSVGDSRHILPHFLSAVTQLRSARNLLKETMLQ